jgi:hypothetical protein
MKTPVRYFLAILVIGLGTALWATSPETSKHFVVTNNVKRSVPNTGTVLTLGGTHAKPSLQETATLSTNVVTLRGVPGNPNVFAISHGPDVCFFLSEPQNPGNEISAFVYPGFTLEGNYNDPSVTNSNFGISLAARGNFLFASWQSRGLENSLWVRPGASLHIFDPISHRQFGCLAGWQDSGGHVRGWVWERGRLVFDFLGWQVDGTRALWR